MGRTSALELAASIKAGKPSVIEAVNNYINLIEKTNNQYGAFLAVCKEHAIARAEEIQASINTATKVMNCGLVSQRESGMFMISAPAGKALKLISKLCSLFLSNTQRL